MPAGLIPYRALAALLLLLGTACTFTGPPHEAGRALAAPAALADRSFQQVLTIHGDGSERRLIAAGRIRAGEFVLALLTPEGAEVLRLRQDADGITVHNRRGLPPGLTPRAIVADFQLVHWPVASLRSALGSDWTIATEPHGRVLSWRGTPRIRVHYTDRAWAGPVTLEHLRYGYRLEVKTLAHEIGADAGDTGGGA